MAITVDKMEMQVHILVPAIPEHLTDTNGRLYNLSEIHKKDLRKLAKIWSRDLVKKGK